MASLVQLPNLYNENLFEVDSLLKNSPSLNSNGGSFSIVENVGMSEYSNSVRCFIVQDGAVGVDAFFDLGDALEVFLVSGKKHIFQLAIKCEEINAVPDYKINFLVDMYLNGVIFETLETEINLSNWRGLEFRTFSQIFEAPTDGNINFRFRIEANSIGNPNPNFTLNFSGFKLEIDQKNLGLPTAYSLPNGLFQESADFTQIETDIQTLKTQTGWAQYVDNLRTTTAPLVITDTVNFTTIPCNGETKDETQLPAGFTEMFNTTTNKLVAKNVNDKFLLNVRFKARTSAANSSFTIGVDIGTANLISPEDRSFSVGANTQQEFSFLTTYFTRETFIANGGLIKIRPRSGTLSIYDISVIPELTHKSR